ncbi:MAG: tetratricopeptide repeat protein [Clostridia bacterium]|nr:tetratricopeptide repeat protein [Clostridia bacterium]
MSDFHAICVRCEKSVHFNRTSDEIYTCPFCGRTFSYAELSASGNLVDLEKARELYGKAQEYFAKGDYRSAENLFEKVLELDRNNFFADFFYNLSGIYAVSVNGTLCGAETIISLIDSPIDKVDKSSQPVSAKRMFLLHAFRQTYDLLKELFTAIEKLFGTPQNRHKRNEELLSFARSVRKITLIDNSVAMFYDNEIGEIAVSICDLAMQACERISSAYVSEDKLCMPSDTDYEEARSLFAVFSHFVRKIVPDYAFPHYKETQSDLASFVEKVKASIKDYKESNPYSSKRLSYRCENLTKMLHQCKIGLSFAYHSVFNLPGGRKKNTDLTEVMLDAVSFGLEILTPRIFEEADGSHLVQTPSENEVAELLPEFGAFVSALAISDRSRLNARLENFYTELLTTVNVFYTNRRARIRAELEYVRSKKNKQYFYYRNFLYGIVRFSIPALTEIVSYVDHKMVDRAKLLKICKESADDLLYLFDYKTSEIEKVGKFSYLPKLYSYLRENIKIISHA